MVVDRVARGRGRTTKYSLTILPGNITSRECGRRRKLRRRTERDYQELKQEDGLDPYQAQDLPPRRSRNLSYPAVIHDVPMPHHRYDRASRCRCCG